MSNEIGLDELLEEQKKSENLVTIERVEGQDDKVKITPWVSGLGCMCHSSIVVPKDSIKTLVKTNERHNCCGKILIVCAIEFNEGATVLVQDVFAQSLASAQEGDHHHPFDVASSMSENGAFSMGEASQPVYDQTMGYDEQVYKEVNGLNYEQASIYQNHPGQQDLPFNIRCPTGQIRLSCGRETRCVSPGTTCCHGVFCPPGNFCLSCGGLYHCTKRGSHCCYGVVCPPGTKCTISRGVVMCR